MWRHFRLSIVVIELDYWKNQTLFNGKKKTIDRVELKNSVLNCFDGKRTIDKRKLGHFSRASVSLIPKRNGCVCKIRRLIIAALLIAKYSEYHPNTVTTLCLRKTSHFDRLSKFFYGHILRKICNKVIIKYSIAP